MNISHKIDINYDVLSCLTNLIRCSVQFKYKFKLVNVLFPTDNVPDVLFIQ